MMRMRNLRANSVSTLALLLTLLLAAGATAQVKDNMSPEETVKTAALALHDGRLEVIWDLLPPTYQQDITKMVTEFGNNMDAALWAKGTGILKNAAKLLESKETIFIDLIAEQAPELKKADLQPAYKEVSGVLNGAANWRALRLDFLKAPDIRSFLAQDLSPVVQKAMAMIDNPPAGVPTDQIMAAQMWRAKLKDIPVKVESSGKDWAAMAIGTNPEHWETLSKVEGRWVPKYLAADWAKNVAEMKAQLQGMKAQLAQGRMQTMMVLGMADNTINSLMAINTKEEMAAKFGEVAQALGPMIMGGMGGGPPGGMSDGMPPGMDDADVTVTDTPPDFAVSTPPPPTPPPPPVAVSSGPVDNAKIDRALTLYKDRLESTKKRSAAIAGGATPGPEKTQVQWAKECQIVREGMTNAEAELFAVKLQQHLNSIK